MIDSFSKRHERLASDWRHRAEKISADVANGDVNGYGDVYLISPRDGDSAELISEETVVAIELPDGDVVAASVDSVALRAAVEATSE